MGRVQMAGRVVIADGYDRPRHRLDRFRATVSGTCGALLKAGRFVFS